MFYNTLNNKLTKNDINSKLISRSQNKYGY